MSIKIIAASRVLVVFTILTLFFVDAQAQCNTISQKLIQEPIGIFPNEVEDFKLFSDGKFSSLRLGVSTREDVTKILGEPTKIINYEEMFDNDPDWKILILYFSQKTTISISSLDNPKSKIFKPAPEYIGKIGMLRMWAKRKMPFNQKLDTIKFANQPNRDIFNYTMYSDGYGLTYKLFESYTDEKQEKRYPFSKGDIMQIEYKIECPIQRKIFIEDK